MKPTICPVCHEAKRGFWDTEYDVPCADCREKMEREEAKNRLWFNTKLGEENHAQPSALRYVETRMVLSTEEAKEHSDNTTQNERQ